MTTFTAQQLTKVSTTIFQSAGVPAETADTVSRSLVESNLMGLDSHGVIRIMQYMGDLRKGLVNPRAKVEVLSETPTTALLDGHWGFGQVVATQGMTVAISKGCAQHMSSVAIRNCYHVGRVGAYAQMAAEQGLIGIAAINSGGPMVAPFGGTARTLAPNALAAAAPTKEGTLFLMDFATSMTAEGKVRMTLARGQSTPPGWLLDKDGQPTTNPQDYYDGGAILPAAGHKGYGLAMLLDILCGVLTGHGCAPLNWKTGNGVFLVAIDIKAFCPVPEFQNMLDQLFHCVKSGPTAPGVDEILIPGEPEFRCMAQRLAEGIDVPETTWQQIKQEGRQLGLDVEALLSDTPT